MNRNLNVDRRTIQKYYHGYTKPAKRLCHFFAQKDTLFGALKKGALKHL